MADAIAKLSLSSGVLLRVDEFNTEELPSSIALLVSVNCSQNSVCV